MNGGKAIGSAVKFTKFYLIINADANPSVNVPACYVKFVQALRKGMGSTKGGEAAFKLSPDGSYFNAFASIGDSFKAIEEAISQSGANSEDSKVFTIGINCDGDSIFNKDPKDPNKYEIEGQKGQATKEQLADFYIKQVTDHPLVTYLEDPYSSGDIAGFQIIKKLL